jgi:pyridoxamine 5'-phosphate oxidase
MTQNADPIATLRQEYGDAPMGPETLPADPIDAFRTFFESAIAAGVAEPNAMTLATTTAEGPDARVVLLKGADPRGFVFYTNYESEKGRELLANPACALVFSWVEIHRQVRVRGFAEKVSRGESELYFRLRPRQSQLGAWASRQSEVLPSREALEAKMAEVTATYEGKDVPLPAHWGGYRVVPHVVELWQGRRNRLHDRVRYTREGQGFTKVRLSP